MTFQQTLQEKGIETNKLKALFINYVRCSCCPFADACYNSPYNYCIEYIDAFLETENYFKISAKKILRFLTLYYLYTENESGMLIYNPTENIQLINQNLLKERKETE